MIHKIGDSRYRLVSKSKDKAGHYKNLGTFSSLKAAQHHEKAVEFFKAMEHHPEIKKHLRKKF